MLASSLCAGMTMSNFDILAPFGRRYGFHHCSKDSLPCKVAAKVLAGVFGAGAGRSGSASSVSSPARMVSGAAFAKKHRVVVPGQQLVGARRAGRHDGAAAGRRLEQRRGEALGVLGGQTVGVRLCQQLDDLLMRQCPQRMDTAAQRGQSGLPRGRCPPRPAYSPECPARPEPAAARPSPG